MNTLGTLIMGQIQVLAAGYTPFLRTELAQAQV